MTDEPINYRSRVRNSSNQRLLRSLFFENVGNAQGLAVYSLKDKDHTSLKGEIFPSLYRLYMEMDDPTEYEFANTYLDGWEHWQMLLKCTWFIPYITRWREELDLKTKAAALRMIKREAADKNSKNLFQANKILIDRSWETKGPNKLVPRGRPSKDEINGELQRQVEDERRIEEDFARMGLDKNERTRPEGSS